MPYQAAKAVAATFCYDIRWALTPVFGNDFPSTCLHPKDPSFAKFLIDPAIVHYCTIETNRFRAEGASYRLTPSGLLSPVDTPKTQYESPPWKPKPLKQRRGRPADIETESGYGTDPDHSDKCAFSPQVSPRSTWTPINRSLSPLCSPRTIPSSAMNSPVRTDAPHTQCARELTSVPGGYYHDQPTSAPGGYYRNQSTLAPIRYYNDHSTSMLGTYHNDHSTPVAVGYYNDQYRTKRKHSKVAFSDDCDEETTMHRPQTATIVSNTVAYNTHSASASAHTRTDYDAAELLLSLGGGDQTSLPLPPMKRTRRGSTM